MDFSAFYAGKSFDAHTFLGAHPTADGAVFRTFAPAAEGVSVIGEFSGWEEIPMRRIHDGNFWECAAPGAAPGMMYKYRIAKRGKTATDHCDPYGFSMELRPHTASILRDLSVHRYADGAWMRARTDRLGEPLNVYELHLGSWRRKDREGAAGWYTYAELAQLLIPYLLENGYNYVEVLPLSEHPSDESWGYQNTGFFSPTARYGTPEELMEFVDRCHQCGIGVVMDFVPVHFAVDDYALWNYDGTALYEYPHADVGRSEWGSCNFMHSRGEVRSFLQSAAHYWLKEYHFDGLRVDAVSRLIYWQGDPARGVNRDAVRFLQDLCAGLKRLHPTALLAAEDSTAYPGVTKPAAEGGLGFDYKWDLGWMHDTLSYLQAPPAARPGLRGSLQFSMQYFYNERYLLPLSHDESVHGKATVAQKMNGSYEAKFPQARALYLYLYAHPGKKLDFMGNEFAQLREWDEARAQDWDLLAYPVHGAFARFRRDLHRIYLESPALWERDYDRSGFAWLEGGEGGVFAFLRRSARQTVLALLNFSDARGTARLRVPGAERFVPLIDSGARAYGGAGGEDGADVAAPEGEASFTLAPFSGRLYLCVPAGEKGSGKTE